MNRKRKIRKEMKWGREKKRKEDKKKMSRRKHAGRGGRSFEKERKKGDTKLYRHVV